MKKIYLTIILASFHLFSFSQHSKRDKNKIASEILVGSWKFDYAIYRSTFWGKVEEEKSEIFHTDTLYFFNNMMFSFRSHKTEEGVWTDTSIHTGSWEIVNNGKTLIYKNREDKPAYEKPSQDVTLPIRIINKNRIRIDYLVVISGEEKPTKNNTPVFFNRIK